MQTAITWIPIGERDPGLGDDPKDPIRRSRHVLITNGRHLWIGFRALGVDDDGSGELIPKWADTNWYVLHGMTHWAEIPDLPKKMIGTSMGEVKKESEE